MNDGILKVGNKTYYIKFTINTLCNMESDGINVMKIDEDSVTFNLLRGLLFHGLQAIHRKEIQTMDDAGEVMDICLEELGVQEFADVLMGALTKSLGKLIQVDSGK